jgi:hypothetical protein
MLYNKKNTPDIVAFTKYGAKNLSNQNYIVSCYDSARKFLSQNKLSVNLINDNHAIKSYGIKVLNKMFDILLDEFSQISDIILFIDKDDTPSIVTAIKIGYIKMEE